MGAEGGGISWPYVVCITGSRVAVGLAFLGATLLGLGVILLFASNWKSTPGSVKLGCIFAFIIAAYSLGYWLRYRREGARATGEAILFLGALLYGAAIFLIAQGFHIDADEPSLLVLWAAGVLPLAYLLRSRASIVLSVLALAVALGWEASFWLDASNAIG